MKIVISACLLGHKTRYDGQSKPVALPPRYAGAELVAFCPEVAAGFGVPRERIELRMIDGALRAIRVSDDADLTPALGAACEQFVASLKNSPTPVDLFIIKSRSPSCGLPSATHHSGIFATLLRHQFPDTPIIDETDVVR